AEVDTQVQLLERIVRFVENLESLAPMQREAVISRILRPNYSLSLDGPLGGRISLSDLAAFSNPATNPLFKSNQILETDEEIELQVQVLERVVRFVGDLEALSSVQRQGVINRILLPDYQLRLDGPVAGPISAADIAAFT